MFLPSTKWSTIQTFTLICSDVRKKILSIFFQPQKYFRLVLGPNSYNESETIAKYEIMDGAPVRGK